MIPPAIKKFLMKYLSYEEKEIKEELLERNHYITWYCGIDHVVDRTKTPEAVIIVEDFSTYTFIEVKTKRDEEVVIKYKENIAFFYDMLKNFIKIYYEKGSFEMRIIRIPDGFHYLEFKLDDTYSFVFQMVFLIDDEERKELDEMGFSKDMPREVNFDEVFKKITIGDDMEL